MPCRAQRTQNRLLVNASIRQGGLTVSKSTSGQSRTQQSCKAAVKWQSARTRGVLLASGSAACKAELHARCAQVVRAAPAYAWCCLTAALPVSGRSPNNDQRRLIHGVSVRSACELGVNGGHEILPAGKLTNRNVAVQCPSVRCFNSAHRHLLQTRAAARQPRLRAGPHSCHRPALRRSVHS